MSSLQAKSQKSHSKNENLRIQVLRKTVPKSYKTSMARNIYMRSTTMLERLKRCSEQSAAPLTPVKKAKTEVSPRKDEKGSFDVKQVAKNLMRRLNGEVKPKQDATKDKTRILPRRIYI